MYIDQQVQSLHLRAFAHCSRELFSICGFCHLKSVTHLPSKTPCMQRRDKQIYRPPYHEPNLSNRIGRAH